MEELPQKQENIREQRIAQIQPYQYKKGQSGNPSGRPKGISLKEYARNKLLTMTDDEREEFFNGLSKDIIWQMAEGKAKSEDTLTVELPVPLDSYVRKDDSIRENKEPEQTA